MFRCMIQKTTFELEPETREKLLVYLNNCKNKGFNIGLYQLDITDMEAIFLPVLEKEFGLVTRFDRVWGHFTTKGGERPFHNHAETTMVYYLDIPEGDVGMLVYEGAGEIIPKTGDLYIFPPRLRHKITANKTDKTRWAIASSCSSEDVLFKELVKKNS